jgi:hypothetical protein
MMSGSGEPLRDGFVPAGLNNASLRWWSCMTCGGVSVPVHLADEAIGDSSTLDARGVDCPRCETRRRRFEPPTGCPTVWYDTRLRDWVVRLPVIRLFMDAILPLGLRWFDTPWVEVYRAAADVAFAAEAFTERDVGAEAAEDADF